MLLGVSIGVICNKVLPEWLITILFAVFLGFCTFKTCKSGFFYWKLENGNQELENGLLKNGSCDETDEPLLEKGGIISSIPWLKMGMLVIIWFSFFFLYLLRGNQYGQVCLLFDLCLHFTSFGAHVSSIVFVLNFPFLDTSCHNLVFIYDPSCELKSMEAI